MKVKNLVEVHVATILLGLIAPFVKLITASSLMIVAYDFFL